MSNRIITKLLLAIVKTEDNFYQYLYTQEFVIRRDHAELKRFMAIEETGTTHYELAG